MTTTGQQKQKYERAGRFEAYAAQDYDRSYPGQQNHSMKEIQQAPGRFIRNDAISKSEGQRVESNESNEAGICSAKLSGRNPPPPDYGKREDEYFGPSGPLPAWKKSSRCK